MTTTDKTADYISWARIGLIALPLSGVSYVMGFWVDVAGTSRWWSLAFPPGLLIAIVSLSHFYARGHMRPLFQIALVCAGLATATFLMMITTQWSIRAELVGEYQALAAGAERTAARWALRTIDQAQQAFDIAWDVWISLATAAFGLAIVGKGRPLWDRFVGLAGIAAGTAGLAINLYAFPVPPAQVGLIDPGVFFFA